MRRDFKSGLMERFAVHEALGLFAPRDCNLGHHRDFIDPQGLRFGERRRVRGVHRRAGIRFAATGEDQEQAREEKGKPAIHGSLMWTKSALGQG